MSDIWYLKDGHGGIVGPVTKAVATELLRSRPGFFVHASNNGSTWQAVRTHAATTAFTGQESPAAKAEREGQAAARMELELDRYREMAPHHLFGVPQNAELREFRQGFLNLAARYHPGRLPRDVSPALLRATAAMYQFLTEVMDRVSKMKGGAPEARPSAPAPAIAPPRPSAPAATPSASVRREWSLDVLSPRPSSSSIAATLAVTPDTAFVFSVHQLLNIKNEGIYLPCTPSLPVGTRMEFTFQFLDAHREVFSVGEVTVENTTITTNLPLRGFGVRLEGMRPMDKGFMLREVKRLENLAR